MKYEELNDVCDEITNDLIDYIKRIAFDPIRSSVYTSLKKHHLKIAKNSNLSKQELLDITQTAFNLTKKEVGHMLKTSLIKRINDNDFYRLYTEHLDNLLKEKKSHQKIIQTEIESNKEIIKPSEKFVSVSGVDNFYQRLIKEINETYKNETYTSSLILSRKLIENLLIDLLRKKYGDKTKTAKEIYYNINNGRFHSFTYLVKNLEDKKSDFDIDKELIEEFLSLVKPFRKKANSKAHSLIYFVENKEELMDYHLPRMVDLLLRIQNDGFDSMTPF